MEMIPPAARPYSSLARPAMRAMLATIWQSAAVFIGAMTLDFSLVWALMTVPAAFWIALHLPHALARFLFG